jgi:hypothetical protein
MIMINAFVMISRLVYLDIEICVAYNLPMIKSFGLKTHLQIHPQHTNGS